MPAIIFDIFYNALQISQNNFQIKFNNSVYRTQKAFLIVYTVIRSNIAYKHIIYSIATEYRYKR